MGVGAGEGKKSYERWDDGRRAKNIKYVTSERATSDDAKCEKKEIKLECNSCLYLLPFKSRVQSIVEKSWRCRSQVCSFLLCLLGLSWFLCIQQPIVLSPRALSLNVATLSHVLMLLHFFRLIITSFILVMGRQLELQVHFTALRAITHH
jgi:hypothetical protein